MGADTFFHVGKGKTVKEAFSNAVEEARYDHGHGGYTGTIAEKSSYVEIQIPIDFQKDEPNRERAISYADHLINNDDPRIDDKWGPAGAIKLNENSWIFVGWASS